MLNILLVDDNVDNLTLNKHLLRALKCTVTTQNSPFLALKLLEHDNPFDVIITDVKMPKMNGIEFFELVRALYPDSTLFFTSASSYAEVKEIIPLKEAAYSLFGGYFTMSRFKLALDAAMRTKESV